MMHMEHRLAQTQSQRLMLTQKMQQAVQILQLSTQELEQYVEQELQDNPVLEEVADGNAVGLLEVDGERRSASADADSYEDVAFDVDAYAKEWREGSTEGQDLSRNRENDESREYYQNSITSGRKSLTSHLLEQLNFVARDDRTYALGERIIGDIDDRGYFTGSLENIAAEFEAALGEVEGILRIIQTFDPPGVGARTVTECLLLQIDAEYGGDEQLRELVSNHLEELEKRQIPKIAKAMGITPEQVEALKTKLSRLNPWPGNEFGGEPAPYIQPDVIVEKDEENDDYVVYLADESLPKVRINEAYQELARNGHVNSEEKEYIRQKMESARWLLRNIEQRKHTILRIATAIINVQRDFLDKGVEGIKPLTLQEIADRVGMHEATISRTTRGKYIQTPQGLFEMKYFFSSGLRNDSGESQSSKSVQSIIKRMVEEEDKRKPLSDQKIAEKLKKDGINIARRTVTKYREAMGISPAAMRRSYGKSAV
ncbi:MAG: RNA polymerase factor sigma-54 [Candidatus Hydrogenedentota bacterium]